NDPATLEATWVDASGAVIKCHAYSNGQMDMLRADLGADAPQYEALLAQVEAEYVPPEPPTLAERQAEIVARIQALEDQHLMPRITRETIIALAEERAVAMGLTIEYLRAKNKGYAGLKTLDEQSAALRSQLP
ncbi:hypothetical protein ACQCP7_25985, partial [Ralstonia pseudosolanacearum]